MGRLNERSAWLGMKRGFARRCPNCGEGALFCGYLKVQPTCAACGHENGAYRADDGPAYFTLLIVGHVVVAPLLAFPFIWTWNPAIVVALTLPLVTVSTLTTLAYVKGAFIGVQWAARPFARQ
jgi:uncharacterized protein (DUF983 family)